MKSRIRKTFAVSCITALMLVSSVLAQSPEPTKPTQRPEDGRRRYRRNDVQRSQPEGAFRRQRGMQRPGMSPGRDMMPGRGMQQGIIPPPVKQQLALTEEQTKKIEKMENKQSEKVQKLTEEQQQLRDKLEQAVEKGDKEAINKIAKEIGNNIADTALLKVSVKEELKDVLNEEQMNKIEEFKKKRAEMRENMRKQMEERMERRRKQFDGNRGNRQPTRERPSRQGQQPEKGAQRRN